MTLLEFLRAYMCLNTITRLIENRTPTHSLIFDRVFTNREQRAVSRVSLAEVNRTTKSMPVISRGGKAIPLDPRAAATTLIEPLSIRLSNPINGAYLNDLRGLYGAGDESGQNLITAELDRMVLDLMNATDLTRNALCAQALKGKIDYQMESANGLERYEISYSADGETSTYSPDLLLDDETATLVDVYQIITGMRKVLSDAGYSGTIEIMAGMNAWSTIANLIAVTPEASRLGSSIAADHITIAGVNIYLNTDTYTDKDSSGNEVVKDAVDSNSLVMYITGSGRITYCAIDDVSGNLQATPFFSRVITIDDPSGYNVISESKPLPLIAPKSICWATVTASMGRRTALTINTASDSGAAAASLTPETNSETGSETNAEANAEETK